MYFGQALFILYLQQKNSELSYYLDAFLRHSLGIMHILLQHLQSAADFSPQQAGVVQRLCPDRLAACDKDSSLLLSKKTTGRLVSALRQVINCENVKVDTPTEASQLRCWKNLVRDFAPSNWPVRCSLVHRLTSGHIMYSGNNRTIVTLLLSSLKSEYCTCFRSYSSPAIWGRMRDYMIPFLSWSP